MMLVAVTDRASCLATADAVGDALELDDEDVDEAEEEEADAEALE